MRRLCGLAGGRCRSYAERFPSLLDPLPGLHFPPDLHDKHEQQSPPLPLPHTEVTTLPNGVRISSHATHTLFSFLFLIVVADHCCGIWGRRLGPDVLRRGDGGLRLQPRDPLFGRRRLHAGEAGLPGDPEPGPRRDRVQRGGYRRQARRGGRQGEDVLQVAEAREELSFLVTNPELFLPESLHRVGYSGALGNPLFPTKEALARIDRGAIHNFYFLHQA